MNRSSRLHWHRPTRRRTPSAGVVRRAGFGSRGNSHSSPAGLVIAACGLRVVPVTEHTYEEADIAALRQLASMGLAHFSPKRVVE